MEPRAVRTGVQRPFLFTFSRNTLPDTAEPVSGCAYAEHVVLANLQLVGWDNNTKSVKRRSSSREVIRPLNGAGDGASTSRAEKSGVDQAVKEVCQRVKKEFGVIGQITRRQREDLFETTKKALQSKRVTLSAAIHGGDFAVIYRGMYENQDVAVKALPTAAWRNRVRMGFDTAQRTAERLRDASFIRVKGAIADPEVHAMVMEYVDWPTLGDEMKRRPSGRLPPQYVAKILARISLAQQDAHKAGEQIGALSPASVYVNPEGEVRLTPFRIEGELARGLTMSTGQLVNWDVLTMLTPEIYWGRQPKTKEALDAHDAPWRIEPNINSRGIREYGAIPIQVTIHDTDIIPVDVPGHTFGNFCALIVGEETATGYGVGRFELDDLAEIERSGPWGSTSSYQPSELCRPDEAPDRCERLRSLSNTAEWHAVAWYRPLTRTAGSDIPLELTAKITKKGSIACDFARESDLYTLRNHVTVHLGETAMPRFDNRWLYGDLHYHSQGTDNEGEAGYNYRGVIRAMGAMGLDFAVAAEHASNSRQYTDIDQSFALKPCPVDIGATRNRLRDISLNRFRYLRNVLHGAAGVNRTAAFAGSSGRYPQGYLSHGVIPQLMLGGELDVIPETDTTDRYVPYGNGLLYDMNAMRRGTIPEAECFVARGYKFWDETPTGWLVGDVQGLNRSGYGREHLIFIPSNSTDRNAFVASDTSDFGGARRRLADAHNGVDRSCRKSSRKATRSSHTR